jgi:hypothetical protein
MRTKLLEERSLSEGATEEASSEQLLEREDGAARDTLVEGIRRAAKSCLAALHGVRRRTCP